MTGSESLTLWRNARICPSGDSTEVISRGAIAVSGEKIVWIGRDDQVPAQFTSAPHREHDLEQAWITPGLVDCHTHLVYAGTRAAEFEQRLEGATYEEIARAGGGINSTVRATRAADEETLLRESARRLESLLAEGVMAVEIKSGYGLCLATERKMLQVARKLGEKCPVDVYTTFLGAHALPPEFAGRPDDYIQVVCDEMLPALSDEGLIDSVDVFCESIGFTVAQSERVYQQAAKLGLPVKMHAEQLTNSGGAHLACRHKALSADHLEHLDEAGVVAMKNAGVVAVLLPGAFYFLRDTKLPPIDLLRKHKVPIALSTDSNPGTSPTTSLLLMLNMACTLFRMTPAEALLGVTRNGAQALGKSDRYGTLEAGRFADFCVWDIDSLAELSYWSGFNPLGIAVRHGAITQTSQRHSERLKLNN
ncbi:MAG TPA: imidazolonepropionase [Bryobacteraceae bacterium]|nr:imidazolonepropionase [Bryobacteraceae bacterium]